MPGTAVNERGYKNNLRCGWAASPWLLSAYLLPGLTAGIFARSGGRLSPAKFSTFISTKLTKGQPKSGLVSPLRSTMTPTAETIPPRPRTMSIVSCTRPPRVTTSSTTMNFSSGEIWKPRRKTSLPSSFSTKIWRLPNQRPTSWPTMIPPRAGEMTVSQSKSRSLSASCPHTCVAMSVCCNRIAHWKYWRLCNPDRKTKWPSSNAPVLRKSARRSSLIRGARAFCPLCPACCRAV